MVIYSESEIDVEHSIYCHLNSTKRYVKTISGISVLSQANILLREYMTGAEINMLFFRQNFRMLFFKPEIIVKKRKKNPMLSRNIRRIHQFCEITLSRLIFKHKNFNEESNFCSSQFGWNEQKTCENYGGIFNYCGNFISGWSLTNYRCYVIHLWL